MADYTKLDALISNVLEEMRSLKYSENTITGFRRMFAAFARYADEHGHDEFSEALAVGFVNRKFEVAMTQLYQANPGGSYLKAWLRAMRILLEFKECGCICKRMPGELKRTALPTDLQTLLDSFNSISRQNGHSESTIYYRNGRIKHFLLFLADKGGEDVSCITDSSAHDYILTKSSNHGKSVKAILTAIRCFLRHLYLEGVTDRDLSQSVPNPKLYYAPELPSTWTAEEVGKLMSSIDRGNPVGKRDYAHAAHDTKEDRTMRQSRRLALSCALALACALAACGCALGANSATGEATSTLAAATASTAATSESASTTSESAQAAQQTSAASTVDTSTSFDEEALIAECAGKFEQKTYADAETGESITYNVYLPEGYDASKSYSTVVFIADSSCVGKDAVQSLSQGLGALVWASDEWQDAHECIVLVPTYPVTILDDHSGYTTTEYVEMTKRFIDAMADEYAVDTNRIYGTGQSMGCMTTLILASEYPDLCAACMFVDGQWDVSTLSGLENQTFVYFAAEDDERAFAGQQEVMAMFDADNASYTYQQWDAAWNAEQLTDAAARLTAAGTDANFVSWKTGTIPGSGQGAGVHMASFDYAYNCKAVMEWLFEQSK